MKPFLSGRPQMAAASLHSSSNGKDGAGLRPVGHHHGGNGGNGSSNGGAQPSVECIRQGDKVVRLVVTCTCGEKIEIDCVYPV